MAQYDIGIDLGTTSIIVAVAGKGVVLNQPSVVAVDTRKNQVLAVGDEALAMVGRTPNYISAIRPLKDGVISNHMLTRELICRFVNKVYDSRLIKPRVAVCVPAAITGIESDAVVEAVVAAGARQVFLIDEPLAAAMGSGIDVRQPSGHMVVDIGGGTTDIAVISLGGKVRATSVTVAGNTFDDEIMRCVRSKFNVAIGLRTAEELKKQVACCRPGVFSGSMEVKGRSLLTGLPQKFTVTTEDLYDSILPLVEQITVAAHQVLEKTPPELAGDIFTDGIMLTGGGAMLKGLPEHMSQHLKVKVQVSPDPINCVALGTAQSLVIGEELESGFKDATPRLGRR
ncbi:MAG: rod shape-determining protein [Candidatus Fournierella pullistercoris]|uniref:Cell shape-determining protein MreB n=1 Tax=Candidatus Allofournierella pullistercoris TaxID=2838597 RepID=A0A948T2Q9_9FIRM|nr:rod shape-determining protein [Candidatus Fournierella pullistercoris]